MAATLPIATSPAPAASTPAVDRQQWWADVQTGFSALLTEAAHPATSERLAG